MNDTYDPWRLVRGDLLGDHHIRRYEAANRFGHHGLIVGIQRDDKHPSGALVFVDIELPGQSPGSATGINVRLNEVLPIRACDICISCGLAAPRSDDSPARIGVIGEMTGPLCSGCSFWADGNVVPTVPGTNQVIRFPMACPLCKGTDELAITETISRDCRTYGIYVADPKEGTVAVDYSGDNDTYDEGGDITGVVCKGCGWDYQGKDWESKLVQAVVSHG